MTTATENSGVVNLEAAAKALGISMGTAYTLVREQRFPVRVVRVGAQYKVPRAELARLLGEEE